MGISATEYPKIRAIFFDLDGLLVDSEGVYIQCLEKTLAKPNCPRIPRHLLAMLPGDSTNITKGSIRHWLDHDVLNQPNSPWPDYETFSAEFQAACAKGREATPMLPGASNLLTVLAKHAYLPRSSDTLNGVLCGVHERPAMMIVSNTTHEKLLVKTGQHPIFKETFPASRVLCSDDARLVGYTKRKKPAPDLYLAALSLLNFERSSLGLPADIRPEECLVFEDSVIGVEAARRAGMAVIWVPLPVVGEVFSGWEDKILQGKMALEDRMYPWLRQKPPKQNLSSAERGRAVALKTLAEVDLTLYGIEIKDLP